MRTSLRSTLIALSTMVLLGLTACSALEEKETPLTVIEQLNGVWVGDEGKRRIRFYSDETARVTFPEHQPPLKFIAPYQIIKKKKVGITLGGFWSGPALVDITSLHEQTITVTFPDEEPVILHKRPCALFHVKSSPSPQSIKH